MERQVFMSILPFAPNRVLRLYRGGSGIDRLCGKAPGEDTRFPENWIASCIEGNGRVYHSPGHGISRILADGSWHSFPEYLAEHAAELLGEQHLQKFGITPGVLVKLLDAAEELPLQAHPSREDARRLLDSDCGKTEAWIVLATRTVNGEKPYLLAGFNEHLDREVFLRETLAGKLERSRAMLHKIHVAPGDVIVIRGGLPHAIGPGVTMVEVMEPSDWVLIPEIACCSVNLNEKQRFMGIDPVRAVEIFDFTPCTEEELRARCSPRPRVLEQNASGTLRWLISSEDCELFSVQELTVDGVWDFDNPDSFAIGVVAEGSLAFDGITVAAGGNFFLPFAVKHLRIEGRGRLLLIRPPR